MKKIELHSLSTMDAFSIIFLSWQSPLKSKSSHPEVFCKKGVFRNFAKLTGNTCARVSFLIKLQQSASLNFTEFLRTPFFKEQLRRLLLKIQIFSMAKLVVRSNA